MATDCTCSNFPANLGNVSFGSSVTVATDLRVASSGSGRLLIENPNGSVPSLHGTNTGGGQDITFVDTAGAPKLTVDLATGRVGVGTTSPGATVVVVGDLVEGANANQGLRLWDDGANSYLYAGYGRGSGTLALYAAAGSPALVVAANAAVGVGTASPAYPLDVSDDINASGSVRAGGRKVADSSGCFYS